MFFNSMITDKPYQVLTSLESFRNERVLFKSQVTGDAWPSSARVVRCLVKSINERNPCNQLYFSGKTAPVTGRKEGMMSGQYFPYVLG